MHEAAAQFRSEGWCVLDDVFTSDECDEIVAVADATRFEMAVGHAADGPLSYRPMQHVVDRALVRWACDARWAPFVLDVVGGDVRLYWEQFVTKPPGSITEVPWHQDNGYAPVDPAEYLTCWLALEDATLDNGCMWVLPDSHLHGTVDHSATDGFFRIGHTGEGGVAAPLRKGSVLAFSSLMLHRSGPNHTDGHRRAWILQYCPAEARHGTTGVAFDDRLLVASDGAWLDTPVRERRFDPAGAAG